MTGSHPTEITERIRQAVDIVELVSTYVTLNRAGRSLKGLCPFHNEKTASFHVSAERQTFKCFGCGAGGDVFKFIQLRENVNFGEARAILAARAGISIEPQSNSAGGTTKPELERVNTWAAKWFQSQLNAPTGKQVREYCLTRGITAESIEKFAIGFAPEGWDGLLKAAQKAGVPQNLLEAASLVRRGTDGGCYDAFRNRLMFPIRDALDRTLGFGGRTMGDDDAKYINTAQNILFDKSRCLYGISTAKDALRERGYAIIVEGYVDCILAQQFGFSQALATLGTALTMEHARLLRRYVGQMVLVFDSDAAGRRAAEQAIPILMGSDLDVRLACVPEGKDPADLLVQKGADAFSATLTSGVGALEFKWRQVLEHFGSKSAGPSRRRAVEEFLALIANSTGFGACEPIQRGLLVNQVGKLLGLSSEEVGRELRRLSRRASPAPSSTAPTDSKKSATAHGASAAAMKDLLEVLVNVPDYYSSIASEFDPALLADVELRTIAEGIVALAGEKREFTYSDLLSRFESVEIGRRIVDLQLAGERAGNFGARTEGAITRLQQARERQRIAGMFAGLRNTGHSEEWSGEKVSPVANSSSDGPDPAENFRAIGDVTRRQGHFAARRHLAAPVPVSASPDAALADSIGR